MSHIIMYVPHAIEAFFAQFMLGLHQFTVKDIGILLGILIMDSALSGDNSIAITAYAMKLPERSQGKVIWCGLILAALLRVVCLGFAAFFMANPWVQVLGAGYLFYLCYGHFSKEDGDDERQPRTSFIGVLIGIGFLDLSLSTDNIIAVVAMSQNLAVIVIGVMLSILLLAVASQVVRIVMKKYPSLEHAAYVILAFLGVMMIVEHGAETIIWLGDKINGAKAIIAPLHFNLGDMGEIGGVALILFTAIVHDIRVKRKQKNSGTVPAETESV